jgi:hypothetical protein
MHSVAADEVRFSPFNLILQKKGGSELWFVCLLNQTTISLSASIAVVSIGTSTVEVFSFY